VRAIAKEWLKAAKYDLMTIEEIIDNPHLTHIVAFHAQQCIEKSMKAITEEKKIDIPKIHTLIHLYDKVSSVLDNLDEDLLMVLDGLYIESRYPGDMGLLPDGQPNLDEAKRFYSFARKIFETVTDYLS